MTGKESNFFEKGVSFGGKSRTQTVNAAKTVVGGNEDRAATLSAAALD